MQLKNFKKGQGTLEYAIIIVVVVAALLVMQWYIKGGYQGKLKQASDEMGGQYAPTQAAGTYTTTTTATQQEDISGGSLSAGAMPKSTSNYTQTQSTVGSETLQGLNATGQR